MAALSKGANLQPDDVGDGGPRITRRVAASICVAVARPWARSRRRLCRRRHGRIGVDRLYIAPSLAGCRGFHHLRRCARRRAGGHNRPGARGACRTWGCGARQARVACRTWRPCETLAVSERHHERHPWHQRCAASRVHCTGCRTRRLLSGRTQSPPRSTRTLPVSNPIPRPYVHVERVSRVSVSVSPNACSWAVAVACRSGVTLGQTTKSQSIATDDVALHDCIPETQLVFSKKRKESCFPWPWAGA